MLISLVFTIYMLEHRSHEQKNARSKKNIFYSIFCRLGAAFKGTQLFHKSFLFYSGEFTSGSSSMKEMSQEL